MIEKEVKELIQGRINEEYQMLCEGEYKKKHPNDAIPENVHEFVSVKYSDAVLFHCTQMLVQTLNNAINIAMGNVGSSDLMKMYGCLKKVEKDKDVKLYE